MSAVKNESVRVKNIDVLVIGGGIGAVVAALKAKESGAESVVLVDKGAVGKSGNSAFAAGVMHVFFPGEDDLDDRVRRLTRSLGYLARQDMIRDHLQDSFRLVEDMQRWGVDFVKDGDVGGKIKRVRGRGQYGVITFFSTQLMDALRQAAQAAGVRQVNRVHVTDLLSRDGRVVGAAGFHTRSADWYVFEAKSTIIATGSTWYKGICPGHRDTSGDGFGMALRAGAELTGNDNDMTANAMPARIDAGPGMNKFVGEGGIFVNRHGERFMENYNPTLKERSGLGLLTAFFAIEAKLGNTPIYLDLRKLGPDSMDRLYQVIPLPMRMFESVGAIQNGRFVDRIEWSSAAPVGRPGIWVERDMRTSLPGLWACGEAATAAAVVTGLAAAGTSGDRAGRDAAGYARSIDSLRPLPEQEAALRAFAYAPLERNSGVEPDTVVLAVQDNVIPYDILFMRHADRLARARQNIEAVQAELVPALKAHDPHYLRMAHEAMSLALTAELHLKSAEMRTESRVALREDYPLTDNDNWLKWIIIRQQPGGLEFSTRDVPVHNYPIQPKSGKQLAYPWQRALDTGKVKFNSEGLI